MLLAASSMDRVAFGPPMSVLTQPGETEQTEMFLGARAIASCRVAALRAALDRL